VNAANKTIIRFKDTLVKSSMWIKQNSYVTEEYCILILLENQLITRCMCHYSLRAGR
jgi:hypothetical protein